MQEPAERRTNAEQAGAVYEQDDLEELEDTYVFDFEEEQTLATGTDQVDHPPPPEVDDTAKLKDSERRLRAKARRQAAQAEQASSAAASASPSSGDEMRPRQLNFWVSWKAWSIRGVLD